MTGFLSNLFSSKAAFALDISDDDIQLLQTNALQRSALSFNRVELEPGIVQDGRIMDQERLAAALRSAVAGAAPRPPKTMHVVAEVPESQTFIHHLTIEGGVDPKDVSDTVVARAEEVIPLDLEASAWDFQILSRSKETYEILFAAASADVVEAYEQTLALAGLDLKILELESSALTRAVVDIASLAPDAGAAVIDIGGRFTTFALADAEGLQLSATIHAAGDAVTETIAKKLKIELDAAEMLKREQGFGDAGVAEAIRKVLKEIAGEFAEASAFYSKKTDRKVVQALLVGGSSALQGVDGELSALLGIPVAFGVPPFSAEGLLPHQIAVVSGLAMRARKLSPGINFIDTP
ncbi:type IV pilus assembly protein PilM [Patescibacteria group bacterium]|nr:type IV pilus assembly protein PilM [Patescibacteria group bacterium]MBU2612860.1 type IV pilus assembly protein PilM [Patescibacteria group bacterium]